MTLDDWDLLWDENFAKTGFDYRAYEVNGERRYFLLDNHINVRTQPMTISELRMQVRGVAQMMEVPF